MMSAIDGQMREAVSIGSLADVKQLTAAAAAVDIACRTSEGPSLLHLAASRLQSDSHAVDAPLIVRALLASGAVASCTNTQDGSTALHVAICSGDETKGAAAQCILEVIDSC